jgi:hypothetical protein
MSPADTSKIKISTIVFIVTILGAAAGAGGHAYLEGQKRGQERAELSHVVTTSRELELRVRILEAAMSQIPDIKLSLMRIEDRLHKSQP